jgi:hypothetical protein
MESNPAEAVHIAAIQEQAEKRQRQQLYESFMRVMALEWGAIKHFALAEISLPEGARRQAAVCLLGGDLGGEQPLKAS